LSNTLLEANDDVAVILLYNKIRPDHVEFYRMFDESLPGAQAIDQELQGNLHLVTVDLSHSALIPVRDIFGVPTVPAYVILDKGQKTVVAAYTPQARHEIIKYL